MEAEKFIIESMKELSRGVLDSKHPFRYFTLATIGSNAPEQRIVVLRQFHLETASLMIHTDSRSTKVGQLKDNADSHGLFWHPGKRLQIRVKMIAELLANDLGDTSSRNLSDYNSILAPGEPSNGSKVAYESTPSLKNFQAIKCNIQSVDVLQLDRPQHKRAGGTFQNDQLVKSTWLVP